MKNPAGKRCSRRGLIAALGMLAPFVAARAQPQRLPGISVVKDRACTCCTGWIDHVRAAGFPVTVTDVDDMAVEKQRLRIPDALQSCHSASLDGYVIEGHVPAADMLRLLAERPQARGLAVPGMPPSAPGMDMPGQPYRVLLFDEAGATRVFAQY